MQCRKQHLHTRLTEAKAEVSVWRRRRHPRQSERVSRSVGPSVSRRAGE